MWRRSSAHDARFYAIALTSPASKPRQNGILKGWLSDFRRWQREPRARSESRNGRFLAVVGNLPTQPDETGNRRKRGSNQQPKPTKHRDRMRSCRRKRQQL